LLNARRYFHAFCCLILLLALTAPALAEEGIHYRGWGLRGGLTIDPDQVHVGTHLDLGEFRPQLRFMPNIEAGFGDDETVVAVNAETFWVFRSVQLDLPDTAGAWRPYVGGGVGLVWVNRDLPPRSHADDSETDIGLNIMLGVEHGLKSGRRFLAELKVGLVDAPDVKLTAGITF
jgi:hypothetical protein